ncbi:MAG: DUF2157 domain-containing protein [Methyloligellaceae bacterium]
MTAETAELTQSDTDCIPEHDWALWTYRIMLGLGTSLVLAGIVFFFAYNWNAIHPFSKFGIVLGAMILCLAGVIVMKIDSLPGKLLLLSASVLVGVFMAVFGQVYQTGADAYQLFMMWAILTIGWTLISKFPTQWVFWLVVTNTFVLTYWYQEIGSSFGTKPLLYMILLGLNGVALILREVFLKLDFAWLNERWTRIIGVLVILGISLIPLIWYIFSYGEFSHHSKAPRFLGLSALAGALALAASLYVYRFQIKDLWAHAISVIALWVVLEVAGARFLYLWLNAGKVESPGFLFLALLMTIGLVSGLAHYLRNLKSNMLKGEAS